nr:GntR family transcriptional regulator [Kibdelosporangium sp. MJ126-NF4]CEL19695.1 Transcriptional regulator, GntR family [Kibdelosporangium sp. MJ126-NF4]CTQ96920.1 Transcriptional regulator, GntR family [Kibdelosporangium sp. MJ126-NF4]
MQIKDDLLLRISSGEWPVGERFPSLRALATQYEVAELTVHTAVRELQRDGILVSTSGRGTFVREVPTSTASVSDDDVLDELHAIRAELAELRQRVLNQDETAATMKSNLDELTHRVDDIQAGNEAPTERR